MVVAVGDIAKSPESGAEFQYQHLGSERYGWVQISGKEAEKVPSVIPQTWGRRMAPHDLIYPAKEFEGERIDRLSAHEIARRGLVLCPERGRPFVEMTVKDNLLDGGYLCESGDEIKNNLTKVYELFPRLKEREKQISGTLSGGERQMLCIGRALMHQPKLLLVDEPSSGLAPKLKEDLFKRIEDIFRELGVTILLAEQDVSFAFSLSSRNYVMSRGHIISEGSAKDLLADETIRKTYLGL